jgi:hypothetical protein
VTSLLRGIGFKTIDLGLGVAVWPNFTNMNISVK